MGQEDTETEISFESLKAMVNNAIKTKNICIIDEIKKDNQLRYIQKVAELEVSFEEIETGMYGVVLAFSGIGISFALTGISKILSIVYGIFVIIITLWLIRSWNKKIKPDFVFKHELILKIQEKLQ